MNTEKRKGKVREMEKEDNRERSEKKGRKWCIEMARECKRELRRKGKEL